MLLVVIINLSAGMNYLSWPMDIVYIKYFG
jgi:hypothetical protein